MKKIICIIALLLFPVASFAQETDCPFGFINDPTPGSCVRYVDTDGNNICDLSQIPLNANSAKIAYTQNNSAEYISEEELKQKNVSEMAVIYGVNESRLVATLSEYLGIQVSPSDSLQTLHDVNGLCSGVAASIAVGLQGGGTIADVAAEELVSGQELKTMTVEEVAGLYAISPVAYAKALGAYYKTDIRPTDSFQLLHDNAGLEPSVAKDIAIGMLDDASTQSIALNTNAPVKGILPKGYSLIPITLVLVLLYINTYLLSKKKVISAITHKRIWNVLLLLSFLVSGLLGLLLVIRINYGWAPRLPFNMLYWHVEAGLTMAIISFFHIFEHTAFYISMFKHFANKDIGKSQ